MERNAKGEMDVREAEWAGGRWRVENGVGLACRRGPRRGEDKRGMNRRYR